MHDREDLEDLILLQIERVRAGNDRTHVMICRSYERIDPEDCLRPKSRGVGGAKAYLKKPVLRLRRRLRPLATKLAAKATATPADDVTRVQLGARR
ncbi:hypothetical protein [Bradyrhizobium liaoningense]|uniref:hypothetical protein n=1 Tax=Bradyrhizobium liaoningense TaxID=43992 RepID=UPI001BA82F27|nr:hypothetical protein [Bradyrhizobium liaoningense]MBR0718674.1 hypothetical protein [Bradyrhizobium liaoningense]